ncbi:MAG: hypothetical protein ACRCXB_08950 [Aeromonadaceae bacterium]
MDTQADNEVTQGTVVDLGIEVPNTDPEDGSVAVDEGAEQQVQPDDPDSGNDPEPDNGQPDPENPEPVDPDDDELALFLGDEEASPPDANQEEDEGKGLVKHLRSEIKTRNDELRAKDEEIARLRQISQPVTEPVKPTLEGCDYDDAKYESELDKYYTNKRAFDDSKKQQEEQQKQFMAKHNELLGKYETAKKALKVKGFDVAEKRFLDEVPENVQGMILHYAEKPEIVALALGTNADLRKKFAEVKDPIAFGKMLRDIERDARLLPKGKKKPVSSAPEAKKTTTAKPQTKEDLAFTSTFSDGVIK